MHFVVFFFPINNVVALFAKQMKWALLEKIELIFLFTHSNELFSVAFI
jgi:hypothetical protein